MMSLVADWRVNGVVHNTKVMKKPRGIPALSLKCPAILEVSPLLSVSRASFKVSLILDWSVEYT